MENKVQLTKFKVGEKVSVPMYITRNQGRKLKDFRHGIVVEKCKNNFYRVNIITPEESENYDECFWEEDLFTEEQEKIIKKEATYEKGKAKKYNKSSGRNIAK